MGLLKNIFTLGGAYRLDKAEERHRTVMAIFDRIVGQIRDLNTEIEVSKTRIKTAVVRTKRKLLTAQNILEPPCTATSRGTKFSLPTPKADAGELLSIRAANPNGFTSTELSLAGTALGTATAVAAWQAVQVIGIASTGTAILGLHGAAATNAGWALFGGGSLATGGGGMAVGHLILPGVGLAVAIGAGAFMTHTRASELNDVCDKIEDTNKINSHTLAVTDSGVRQLREAEMIYNDADYKLTEALKSARKHLRRFGWFSVFYRYLRFRIRGVYYTSEELMHVENLDLSLRGFFDAFNLGR